MRKGIVKRNLRRALVVLMTFFAPYFSVVTASAQSPAPGISKADHKKQKAEEKEKAAKKKEERKAQKKLRKQHLSIQTKDVRKRMKKNFRQTDKANSQKRERAINRWRKR